jgi:2'-5' RNA ligase
VSPEPGKRSKRLFLAVDIDDRTRAEIDRISAAVRQQLGARTKASWVKADRMHLTLHFFAAADPSLEQRIIAALEAPIRQETFDVSFDGLGSFPERGSPRVLWLGIGDGAAELGRIERLLHNRLNLKRDRSEFTPHLTLARFRERVAHAKLAEIQAIRASAGPSRIDRVTLYESRLSPAGPTYLKLAEAPLLP